MQMKNKRKEDGVNYEIIIIFLFFNYSISQNRQNFMFSYTNNKYIGKIDYKILYKQINLNI